jgi:translation elongation factor P/translation initiation factor 5A
MILAQFLEVKMLNAFNVRWLDRDETKIKFTDKFKHADYVLKIDILQDAIALLEQEKDKLMFVEHARWDKKRKGVNHATV